MTRAGPTAVKPTSTITTSTSSYAAATTSARAGSAIRKINAVAAATS
jgi:hypothetical protein